MKLSKLLTTVTPFSKYLALLLFIVIPLITFFIGINYQKMQDKIIQEQNLANSSINNFLTKSLPPQIQNKDSWKIYQNNKYNFSLKYPSDWTVVEDDEHEKKVSFIHEKGGGQLSLSFADSSLPLIDINENQLIKSEVINVGNYSVKFNFSYTSVGGIIQTKDYNPRSYQLIVLSDKSLSRINSRFASSIRQIELQPFYNSEDISTLVKILSTLQFNHK